MAVGQDRSTDLHCDVHYNSLEVAQLFVGAGALVDVKDIVRADCSCLAIGVVCELCGYGPVRCISFDILQHTRLLCRRHVHYKHQ